MAGHVEIERKYEVGSGFRLPDLREVPDLQGVAEPRRHTLVARYYDTHDLRLARYGVTLRRRTGGTDDGWHLKLPKAKGGRDEHRRPAGPATDTVPAELTDLVLAYTRGRPLVAVAELRTDRTERALLGRDGVVLAELADDEVTGVRLEPRADGVTTWRELEVELVDGPDDVLTAVGDRLVDSGAEPPDAPNKLMVVLGERAAPVAAPGETRTAVQVLAAYLAAQVERMLSYDPRVRLADHDDDSVHKMRTSIRRIRSILRTHRNLLDRSRTEPLDAELKWLAGALGEVRDLEVLRARFHRQLAELPAPAAAPGWLTAMERQERQARERLRGVLSSARYLALLDRVDAQVADPPVNERAHKSARKRERKVVTKAWRKMIGAYEKAAKGEDRDAALHQTRKAAKRLRYTAEAARPVLGNPAGKIADRAHALQDVLGDHQDRIVAAAHLQKIIPPSGSASDGYALGALLIMQRCGNPLPDLPKTWHKAADPKPFKHL